MQYSTYGGDLFAMTNVKKIEDIFLTLLLFLFFAVTLSNTDDWISVTEQSDALEVGPRFFPIILCTIALVLLVWLLISQIREYRLVAVFKTKREAGEVQDSLSSVYILFKAVLSIFLFIYFMKYLGFVFSSIIFLIFIQLILGNRSLYKITLFAIGVLFACYLIFIKLLQVQLPRGVGIFEQISYFLY
jgi:Na+/melibiose symporter-like transporter